MNHTPFLSVFFACTSIVFFFRDLIFLNELAQLRDQDFSIGTMLPMTTEEINILVDNVECYTNLFAIVVLG